ncbi:MAG: hypothetical protein ABIF19_12405 [Planctomycetota bacterium]
MQQEQSHAGAEPHGNGTRHKRQYPPAGRTAEIRPNTGRRRAD